MGYRCGLMSRREDGLGAPMFAETVGRVTTSEREAFSPPPIAIAVDVVLAPITVPIAIFAGCGRLF